LAIQGVAEMIGARRVEDGWECRGGIRGRFYVERRHYMGERIVRFQPTVQTEGQEVADAA
jgi:hypothetical protein